MTYNNSQRIIISRVRTVLLFVSFGLVLLQTACVPEETDFLSPVPVATEATDITFTSFTANWSASLGVDSYILEVAKDVDFNSKLPGFPIEINTTQKVIDGLTDGTTYYFRVRGIFNGANTEYSNIITVVTNSYRTLFPQNLRLVKNNVTEFMVQWDTIGDADGYIVNLAFDSEFASPVSNYFQTDVGDLDTITFHDLLPDQEYYCKVQSYTEGTGTSGRVYSDDSDVLLVKTLAVPPPVLRDPINITPLRFTAAWGSVEHADFYLLDVSEDIDFTKILSGYNQKAVLDTTETINGLQYPKNYYYRVKAVISDKESDFSAIQTVNSGIKSSCRLSKIYFNSTTPTTFHYDAQNRLSSMDVVDRYGTSANYLFTYNTLNQIEQAVTLNFFGDTLNTTEFYYTTEGNIDSLSIQWQNRVEEIKYTYNTAQQLTHYLSTEAFHSNPTTKYLFIEHDYTYDEKGNIKTVMGNEFLYSTFSYRTVDWELRYDEKINPFVLLPKSLARYIPFTINYDRNIPYIPFLPEQNITFAGFTNSTEIIAYNYNDLEVAEDQLGFFEVSYEFEGCD